MDLKEVETEFSEAIQKVRSVQDLLEVKSRFLGRKGSLASLLHSLGALPAEKRPVVGARANELKVWIEGECRTLEKKLKDEVQQRRVIEEVTDVTLPGRALSSGRLHPITRILEEVEEIFVSIGFAVFNGPEVESDYYNFEALNIPPDHPARDMQDTFYLEVGAVREPPLLLRTHTSPVQIRVMEKNKPPIRMIAPGVVYRRDSDVSHSPMFHQVEGLLVGEGIRFSDLKGVLTLFLESFFEKRMEVRFRPSYFPFTEPSAEVDIRWEGGGPASTRGESTRGGWMEVVGCGMVHPNVFRAVGYNPRKVTGFAFGMGIERLGMLKFGIPDIRLFFENDLRFLEQFR